jgi:hypothetical protein
MHWLHFGGILLVKINLGKFTKKWFNLYRGQFCLLNNIVLLIIVDEFDLNPELVNVNKLKPL